jgi:large subunit ribosomal protein L10
VNRAEKSELINSLSERLKAAPLVMVADYRGVTVAEISAFRRALAQKGLEYQVIKNTLAARAVMGTPMAQIEPMLSGMTGWIISSPDGIESARVVRDIFKGFKKQEKLTIKGGYFDGEAYDAEGIVKVADLPGRPELLAKLLATMVEGPRRLLGVLQGPARDLLYVLKNYEKKLAEGQEG